MTSCTGKMRGGFWGIWKKSVSWVLRSGEEGSTFASSQWPCGGCHTFFLGGADGKTSIERLCLSPYVEKPLNSKVIKSFVPELRSRICFSCFGIPMFYVYMLWTLYVCFIYSYMVIVHEFELESLNYVHFPTKSIGKSMKSANFVVKFK